MARARRHVFYAFTALAVGGAASLQACAADFSTGADSGFNPDGGDDAGNFGGGVTSVIAVHASYNFPAFRVCVEGFEKLQPLPNNRFMPQSNLLGVDVGNAAHLGDLPVNSSTALDAGKSDAGKSDAGDASTDGGGDGGALDSGATDGGDGGDGGRDGGDASTSDSGAGGSRRVWIIDEGAIRGNSGTCSQIVPTLTSNDVAVLAVTAQEAAKLTAGGVNFLVLTGCRPGQGTDTVALRACGTDYRNDTGNLRVSIVPADYRAPVSGGFSAQVLALSPALQNARIAFTQLVGEGSTAPIDLGAYPGYRSLGETVRIPFQGLVPDFGLYGFRLSDTSTAVTKTLREQTLADISTFSDPRIVPTDYYELPSNFALLVIGNPDDVQKNVESGKKVHFVAVPVRAPNLDPDASPDGSAR